VTGRRRDPRGSRRVRKTGQGITTGESGHRTDRIQGVTALHISPATICAIPKEYGDSSLGTNSVRTKGQQGLAEYRRMKSVMKFCLKVLSLNLKDEGDSVV
jgi:hypothetical protein